MSVERRVGEAQTDAERAIALAEPGANGFGCDGSPCCLQRRGLWNGPFGGNLFAQFSIGQADESTALRGDHKHRRRLRPGEGGQD